MDTRIKNDLLNDLTNRGFATVNNIASDEDLIDLTAVIGILYRHRDSASNGITYINSTDTAEMPVGYAGFSQRNLLPHTDRSTLDIPPRIVAMTWRKDATAGGDVSVHDFAQILRTLRVSHPLVVKFLEEPGRARYSDGEFSYSGPLLEKIRDGYGRRIRFRLDGNAFYRYDDFQLVQILFNEISKYQHPIRLSPGECIVIDNHRCLHSRGHFSGTRQVLRTLAHTDFLGDGFEDQF